MSKSRLSLAQGMINTSNSKKTEIVTPQQLPTPLLTQISGNNYLLIYLFNIKLYMKYPKM